MGNCSGAEVRGICTEAGNVPSLSTSPRSATDESREGMYALRERRVHVTQEDFSMSISKVLKKTSDSQNTSSNRLFV
jgi:26S proteasome regulatory subunit T6